MNGAGASAGGSSGVRSFGLDVERRERAGEAAAELWLALSQRAVSVQRLPEGHIETPSGWRGSAGDLTPGGAATSGPAAAQADGKAGERLTLRVDGGELGELSVTLDRLHGSLSVVIGLKNERLVSAVLPDVRALRLALENAGLNVHSLSVVPTSQVGTVLAQRRSSPSGLQQPPEEPASPQHPETAQKRNHKRLTLIG